MACNTADSVIHHEALLEFCTELLPDIRNFALWQYTYCPQTGLINARISFERRIASDHDFLATGCSGAYFGSVLQVLFPGPFDDMKRRGRF